MDANQEKPRRSRLRFSLRGLLVLLTITAIGLACVSNLKWQRSAIRNRYQSYQKALENEAFEDAYRIMSPDYRKSHSLTNFTLKWGYGAWPTFPTLSQNPSIRVYWNRAYWFPVEASFIEWRGGLEFQFVDGEWYMTDRIVHYTDYRDTAASKLLEKLLAE